MAPKKKSKARKKSGRKAGTKKTTKRQKKAIRRLAKGKNIKEASKGAGYPERHGAKQALNSRRSHAEFQALVDKMSPDEKIIAKFIQLMEAKKLVGKNANVEDNDNPIQHSAARTLAQLKGRLTEKFELAGTIDINVEISARDLAKQAASALAEWWAKFKKGRAKPVDNFIEESELFTSDSGPVT